MKSCKTVPLQWLALIPAMLMFGCSSFELTSQPDADIYENDVKVGRTPYRFDLVSGSRSFTLKRYGYVEEDVLVTSLAPKSQHYNLQWIGRTRVDTFPGGAKVFRKDNNEELGVTPCGLHLSRPAMVVIKLDGYETEERELIPNQEHKIELNSLSGYKSAFYRDIMFTSTQGAVAIYDRVAGEKIGETPVRLNVEAGSSLEYRLPGYKPEFALISRNAPYNIEITLDPIARIIISGPAGAGVYPAGANQKIGNVPVVVEVDGSSLFEVKMAGYYDRTVAVSPSSPSRLEVDLEKIPYKTIVTVPPGGEVYRLGGLEKLGTAPFTTVVDGERVFEIRMQGYRPRIVGLGPSSPEQMNVTLAAIPRDDPDAAAIGAFDSPVVDSF